jgi:endonuclease G, mitochondrial
VGESVTIVQHPAARRKEVALRENRLVDIPEQVLHYVTDTEPGSSGSPVFNDQWEVVALHHASVPDPSPGGSGSLNEGIRISRILAHLAGLPLDPARRALVDALDDPATPHGGPEAASTPAPRPASATTGPAVLGATVGAATAATAATADGTVAIPLTLTVQVALGAAPAPVPDGPPAPPPASGPSTAHESLAIDPDYAARGGYDPDFLGVPLPVPGAGSNAPDASAELRYHHFSVVMHRARRLALCTAVNVDGAHTDARPRSDDRWILDPRLPREEQTGAEVYADNALDRGHLVRRLDPSWGTLARAANDDTFHYTNSAPQHHAFNAGSTLWLGLEEYLLGTARRDRLRLSVLAGPVLAPDDPPYRGVLLPRQFWKVVAVVDERGRLVVTGYVLGQDAFLPSVLAEATFGAYRTFQVPVSMIGALTGLDLTAYAAADPLGTVEATVAAHELRTYGEIVLGG